MSWFSRKAEVPTVDSLYDAFAAVLDAGPKHGGTIHHIDELPGDKALMKAVLLAKAYEYGPQADEILSAGFVMLAQFQADTREPAERHLEIASEMQNLLEEWRERVKYPAGDENA
ncbi:MAG: hypothetical protein ACKOPE_11850 [Novosphingobium sp.]